MDTETIHFEGGDILATDEPLTIRGLLLPYNEIGRTNVGRFMVEAGTVEVPSDPIAVGINTDHVRHDVVGRAMTLDPQPQGVFATFRFADTDEGRAAYADAIDPNGKRTKLSAEFGPAFIKAGKLVAGHAKLWGAALVEAGAFPSAQVLATDTPEASPAAEPAPTTTAAAPVEANPEGASTVDPIATPDAGAPAAAPATIPGAPQVQAAAPGQLVIRRREVDLRQVFAAIGVVKSNPDVRSNEVIEATQVLAELQDITVTGDDALPADGVLQPNWMGQMYQGIPYVREYIGLGTLGTDISIAGKKAFKISRGTVEDPIESPAGIPNGGDWAGNKTDINSYNAFTETASSFRRQFAVGNDIAREFYDLPGGAEVIGAFLQLVVEDHLVWSDTWALFDLVTQAGVPIVANTGAYPTNYPTALGMLIQGILAVKKRKADGRRDVPDYAIANEAAFEELAYAAGGAENLPAFVNLAISTSSNGTVDGNVQVVQGDIGIEDTAAVQVGAGRATQFDELAGGPLIINALDLARGGIDRAVHGYLQTFQQRPEAVVLIGTADTRANTTVYALGRIIKVGAVVYRVVTAGTSAGAAPAAPAVGSTVVDGTAKLLRLV